MQFKSLKGESFYRVGRWFLYVPINLKIIFVASYPTKLHQDSKWQTCKDYEL